MLKKTVALTAVALGLMMTAPAHADSLTGPAQTRDGFYLGANYSSLRFDFAQNEATPTVFTLAAGYQLSPYVAIEGRYGIGMSFDTSTDLSAAPPFDEKLSIDSLMGGYLKLSYPFSDYVSSYAIFGATKMTITLEDRLASLKGDLEESGYSWGVGINLTDHKNAYLNLEYLRLQKQDNAITTNKLIMLSDYEAEAISLGIHYKF